MVGYELYRWRDLRKVYEWIGVLPERRNNPQRVTKESVLNWGQKYFGIHLNLGDMYFIQIETDREAIRPGIKKANLYNLTREAKRQG
jgi:hypothetical protein